MPNALAYLALIFWPIVALIIKNKAANRSRAVAFAVLVPWLFLPAKTKIDLPGVPAIDKEAIAAVAAFLWFLWRDKSYIKLPQDAISKLLFFGLCLLPIGIILTNREPLVYGPVVIPPVPYSDFLDLNFRFLCNLYIPFMIGVVVFRTQESQIELLKVLLTLGMVYSLLMLFEVRMSPQLHTKIYGFFPHSFAQTMREGGFRPVVFLGHGLLVALFTTYLAVAAAYFYKNKIKFFVKWPGALCAYFVVLLILCKTYSALIYIMLFLPLVFFFRVRTQLKACAIVVILVFIFPILRINDLVPVQNLSDFVATINENRAQSFQFRLDNEEILLEKANEKPIFGWGGWGRQMLYSKFTGRSISVLDGFWIITFGFLGYLGYLIYYGFYCWPVFLFYRLSRNKRRDEEDFKVTACLCIMVTIVLIDSIPNAGTSIFTTLIAGAIMGRAIDLRKSYALELASKRRGLNRQVM